MKIEELLKAISLEKKTPLIEALLEYVATLERGNYKITLKHRKWTHQNEFDLVSELLKSVLKKLDIQDIDERNLQAKIQPDFPMGLFKIAHLLASITILNEQIVQPEKELEQLKAIGLTMQIKATMPAPCIVYLGALKRSSLSQRTKLIQINNIVTDLSGNIATERFGSFSKIALRVALQDWLNTLNQFDPSFKEKFITEKNNYINRLKGIVLVKELTFIEDCILRICKKLNNGIGEINLNELDETRTDKILQPEKSNQNPAKSSNTFFFNSSLIPALSNELAPVSELILGELDNFYDITDSTSKNLLIDLLFNPNMSAEDVAKFAETIDPILGKRFAIIYCCMYPWKWDEFFMDKYRKILIDNNDHQLKEQGALFLKEFIKVWQIEEVNLNPNEQALKEKKLADIKEFTIDTIEIEQDIELLKKNVKELETLIKDEDKIAIRSLIKKNTRHDLSLPNAWKELNKNDQRWPNIYQLINQAQQNKPTSTPEKMLRIVQAILYKEEKHCRWPELPQFFPNAVEVRHYYYQWKSSGILDQIKEIMVNSPYYPTVAIPAIY